MIPSRKQGGRMDLPVWRELGRQFPGLWPQDGTTQPRPAHQRDSSLPKQLAGLVVDGVQLRAKAHQAWEGQLDMTNQLLDIFFYTLCAYTSRELSLGDGKTTMKYREILM